MEEGTGHKKTILLVDDETIVAMHETALLRKHGYTVINAKNSTEALEMARTHQPDLILMDIDLGKDSPDGTEAAKMILQEKALPIIFLTSHAEREIVDKVKGITRYGYVMKNTGEFVLLEAIRMAFQLFEAHRSLAAKEIQARAVIDNIDDAILRFDKEGHIIFFSRGAERTFGFRSEEILGKRSTETINPSIDSTGQDQGKMMAAIFADPLAYAYHENENCRKDGSRIFMSWHNRAIYDDNGCVLYMQAIGRDITEQKQLEKMHSESEERYKQLFENSPISLWVEDFSETRDYIRELETQKDFNLAEYIEEHPDIVPELISKGKIIDVNLATVRLVEAESKAEVLGNMATLALDESHSIFKEEILALYRGESFSSEILGKTTRGNQIECYIEVALVPGFEQTWEKVLVSITDISPLKKMERQKEFLLHELNHRIKNNLAIISSFIELKNSGSQEDLSDIKNQVDAIRIIHDKLYQSDDVTHIDFGSYVEELTDTIFSSFLHNRIRVEKNIHSKALPTRTTVPLGLIVNEIATNAVKHGFTNTPDPKFTVSLEENPEDHSLTLTLANNGSPMPEEVDLQNRNTLGMRIISALVQQLDGTIQLKKNPHPEFIIRFTPEDR